MLTLESPSRYRSGVGVLVVTLALVGVSTSPAAEVVPIGAILNHPEAYALHAVILNGVATQVQRIDPYFNYKYGMMCDGAYTLMLSDETGSIMVEVPGLCGRSPDSVKHVAENDRILLEAHIEGPGYYTGQGLPPGGEVRQKPHAVARRIETVLEGN